MEYQGESIAAVVAESKMQAKMAAKAVQVQYEAQQPILTLKVSVLAEKSFDNACRVSVVYKALKSKGNPMVTKQGTKQHGDRRSVIPTVQLLLLHRSL